jgi:hypothetical protein
LDDRWGAILVRERDLVEAVQVRGGQWRASLCERLDGLILRLLLVHDDAALIQARERRSHGLIGQPGNAADCRRAWASRAQ